MKPTNAPCFALPAAILALALAQLAGRVQMQAFFRDGSSETVDVTAENGPPVDFFKRVYGKGNQLRVDSNDFPTLARTGLHSEAELDAAKTITGKPVSEITRDAQPGALSGAGFLAPGEDIISVLKADSRVVTKLGLTHQQLAEPLFHIWNLELWAFETGRFRSRTWPAQSILYKGRTIRLNIQSSRGWQESIFADEIMGNSEFVIKASFTEEENAFLASRYPPDRLGAVLARLGTLRTGEMVAYYIVRYGFYEGRTAYRADPLAIAFIFGLRTVQQLEAAFPANLDRP